MKKYRKSIMLFFAVTMTVSGLEAGTGMKQSGYDTRSMGLAGATLANMNSVMALENNPSQLFYLGSQRVELNFNPAFVGITYKDSFKSKSVNDNNTNITVPMSNIGYAHRLNDKIVLGLTIYLNGGAGMKMEGLKLQQSPNNYVQDINSTFFNYKISVGGAYQLTNDLILGASIDYSIAQMSSEIVTKSSEMTVTREYLPNDSQTLGFNLGVTYQISNSMTAAYSFSSSNKFQFKGDLSVKIDPVLGSKSETKFENVETEFTMPERHAVGLSTKFSDNLTIMWEFRYQPYSKYFETSELKQNGNTIGRQNPRYDDLKYFAIGSEYKFYNWLFRAGFGHGNGICVAESVNPTNNIVLENDITVGAGYKWNQFDFNLSIQYSIPVSVKGANNSDWNYEMYKSSVPASYSYEIGSDLIAIGFSTVYNF